MATYINIGNQGFKRALNQEYIDKTGLISEINKTLFSEACFSCVSRCRRFGKSMAAKMLCAYYDRSCDSRELFKGLEIEKNPDFEKHLNKYPVIYVDMTNFVTEYGHNNRIVNFIQRDLKEDLHEVYPNVELKKNDGLMNFLKRIADNTGDQFIMIIDEWDAICREFKSGEKAMDEYVNLLRRMFKSVDAVNVFAGVYMTGILPIKKYKTESALNNFREYSMVQPKGLESFLGFTKKEVEKLCEKYNMDFAEMAKWYDGYSIGNEPSMFNPNSVMEAIAAKECDSYWASTGAFEAVAHYIQMDFEGLQGDIVKMLAGGSCPVDTTGFQNDPAIIETKNDVFTVLIHLGYLAYNKAEKRCYVPNMEVVGELKNAIERNGWKHVMDTLNASERLLSDLLDGDTEAVEKGIEAAHERNASILEYNDENSLACVIGMAFYSARNKYKIVRELPSGKGFADLVFVPWRNVNLPAIVVELKWKQDAKTAISQIRERNYPDSLKEYMDEVILCGINYDPKSKVHSCIIDRI